MGSVNLNKRADYVLGKLPEFTHFAGRLAVVSIPFISLYKPARTGIAVLSSSVQLIDLYQSEGQLKEKIFKTALNVSFIFLTMYRPKEAVLCALAAQTYEDIKNQDAYAIFSRIVYFTSLYNRDPRWVVAALALEIAKNGKEARDEWRKGRWLEGGAKLLMAALRTYQTKEEVSRVRRRYFGKEVTQADWDKLLLEKDIGKALKEKNFSDVVKDVKVKPLPRKSLQDVTLKDMVFERVDFSESRLRDATIENVTFIECKMEGINFYKVGLIRVVWENCNVSKGMFYLCRGVGLSFKGCDLTRFCLSECEMSWLEIFASKLYGASFLSNNLFESVIKSCDLMNVLLTNATFELIDCTINLITKPVIALTWDFRTGGSWGEPVPDVMEDQGALTLKFPIYPHDIDREALQIEVESKLQSYPLEGAKSRAQMLLDDPHQTPEIEKMKAKAHVIMKYADGVILSGGENVEEGFYKEAGQGFDYRRSLIEFAVTHIGKPVMGICRGSQLLNVYLGGTLRDVSGQTGRQTFSFGENAKGRALSEKVGEPINGSNAHFQAVDRLGKGLHVLLERKGVVKATMSEDGRLLGTQFHPETYIEEKRTEKLLKEVDTINLISRLLGFSYKFEREARKLISGEPAVQEGNQLSARGQEEIIKLYNFYLRKAMEYTKGYENNRIFFKLFLAMVSRGDSSLRRLEFAPAG